MGGEVRDVIELGVAGMAVFLFYRISSNHIAHLTNSFDKLTDAIRELIDKIPTP